MDEICQEDQWFEQAFTYMNKNDIPLPNDKKLHFYGLFKQATIGDVNIDRPSLIDFVRKAKYDAWLSFKGLSFREARNLYIESLENLKVGWSRQGEYEYIPSEEEIKQGEGISTNAVSSMAYEEEQESDDIFGYTRLNDENKISEILKQNPSLIHAKEEGLAPIHIAADRGYTDLIEFLLNSGSDINSKTDDEDTALHLACISEQLNTVKLLLKKGCDQSLLDSEGKTAFEQADSSFIDQLSL